MSNSAATAFSAEALFSKSRIYIARGLRAKEGGSLDEYQLWASLAIELLAKSSLSTVHPALVADPTHFQSLFAACGHELSPDVKTITAMTLFERLSHISRDFDKRIQGFCRQMALRRNSEIHSGESPFSAIAADTWEAKFWHAAHTILQMQDKELEQWLGAEEAAAPRATLEAARNAIDMMVSTRIAHAQEDFEAKYKNPKKREEAVEASKSIRPWEHYKKFNYLLDEHISQECPACGSLGVLAGSKFEEYESEEQDPDDPFVEYIDIEYSSEEFICLVCGLHLQGTQEIRSTPIPAEFTETEEREREFEPDYGND